MRKQMPTLPRRPLPAPLHRALPVACLALLAACAQINEHRDPEISGMDLTPDTMPEANVISVPMPEPTYEPPPQRAEAASLWKRGSGGFFGDHRAANVGDILTVVISISDEAELRNASDRSRSSGTQAGVDALLGIDEAELPTDGIVDLSAQSSSAGSGRISRRETVNLRVAATIIKKLANGNLVVAGRQEVKVNNELRELRIAGIIRPVDIGMSNSIPYDRIAEARITYGGRGQLSRVQMPRYGEDALDVILPY